MKTIPAFRSPLVQYAAAYADAAHRLVGQRRKYTDEPYINHPAQVVALLRQVPHTVEMLAAAWLHDTVEDTQVTLQDIELRFGAKVAALVEQLTDVSCPGSGNRAARKAIDLAHIALASPEAKTIKLADLIDNTATIVEHDPNFAKVYLEEKARLLEVLVEGDQTLLARARAQLHKAKEKLNLCSC